MSSCGLESFLSCPTVFAARPRPFSTAGQQQRTGAVLATRLTHARGDRSGVVHSNGAEVLEGAVCVPRDSGFLLLE